MITASQGGSKIYGPAHQVQRRFAVKLGQTITFDPPPDTPVHTQVPLTATASSKLQVSFTSGTQGVCTVSGTVTSGFTATTVTPGTCTVTATQSGNGIWAPAPDVTQSFTVTKKGQQITFDPLPSTPAHTRVPLTAKAIPSGLQVSFTSSTERVCTVSGTVTSGFTATTVTPGTCTITATQDGDDTWAAATPVRQSFTVTPPERKPQTITFTRPPDRPVDTRVPLHDPRATPSELPVTFTSQHH
jgi:outer membrane lipoprotein SlyB